MLSARDNELVCKTGPSTPMGEVFRRYWHPILLSRDLPEPAGAPVRVKVLNEPLVAFRDAEGNVGLIDEACPHRNASMFFGLNDGEGLICAYHGFKFDRSGRCIDTPSDAPGSSFRDRVRTTAYPTHEAGGMIWAYMGPPEKQPPFPNFMYNLLPPEQVSACRVPVYCNWLQSVEGNIDSTHLGTLHATYAARNAVEDGSDAPNTYATRRFTQFITATRRYARIDVQDTWYGFRLIAVRPTPNGNQHVRTNAHVLPEYSFIASPGKGGGQLLVVPVDDNNSMRFSVRFQPDRPITDEERAEHERTTTIMDPEHPSLRLKRLDNDFFIDREAQKREHFAGIMPIPEQDYAVTESMGGINDRTKEHLYPADAAIIRLRQMLLTMARNLQEGIEPPAMDAGPLELVHSEEMVLAPDADPWLLGADAGETAKQGEKILV